jgi:ubinuclein
MCVCARASEDVVIIEDDNSDEDNESDKVKRVGPLKRFIWTETVRGLACDVVRAKVRALREINRKMIDPQSQMKAFLRDEVKVLWPPGWMNSRILYLETKSAHESLTQLKPKKSTIQTVVKKKETVGTPLSQSTAKVFFPSPSMVTTVTTSPSSSSHSVAVHSVCSTTLPTAPQILSVVTPIRQLSPSRLPPTTIGHSSVLSQHSYSQPASARPPLSLQMRSASAVRPISTVTSSVPLQIASSVPLQTITSPVPLNQLLSMMNQGHIRGQVQFIQQSSIPQIASTTRLNLPDTSKSDKT